VKLFEGTKSTTKYVFSRLSGNTSMSAMYNSTGKFMLLEFVTDETVNAKGYRGVYASNPGVGK